MAKYYCVLFDADNTLLDFDAAENKALADTLREYGICIIVLLSRQNQDEFHLSLSRS